MDAQHLRARMSRDVDEVLGREAVVDRDHDGADLRHRIEGLELLVRVGRDVGDAVSVPDAHRLQRGRPPVAALKELLVCKTQITVDHALALAVKLAGPPRELERRERSLHLRISYEFSMSAKSVFLMPPTKAL